jgi:hypothetical protein
LDTEPRKKELELKLRETEADTANYKLQLEYGDEAFPENATWILRQ